jgi:hypothetical protein
MRTAALLVVAFALAGCGRSEALEIADVNARNALARAESNSSRIEELERRVAELEARLGG